MFATMSNMFFLQSPAVLGDHVPTNVLLCTPQSVEL
jgi:hypothetical protein